MSSAILFPTSVVGSLPRPLWIQDYISTGGDPFGQPLDKAVAFVVALQEQIGLDIVTDGEWRRKSYIGPISAITESFAEHEPKGQPWRYAVTQPITHKHPGFFAREAAFLRAQTNKKIKICVPSPYLIGRRCWDEKESSFIYPNRRSFIDEIIPILRDELRLLRDAGADIIQIDDPHICLLADSETRSQFPDPEAELRYACQTVNAVLDGLTGVYTALHLCRRNRGRQGWVGQGGYEPIISALSQIQVDEFVMEYTLPVVGDMSALKYLPTRFRIGLGCVDCRFEHIDTPGEIVGRVEKALTFVAPERLTLNPDCGFAPGSERVMSLDEPYLKLKNEVAAAQILRKKYSTRQ